jgi:peptidoglycan/xylan/chitin deacetylase (PgdA/CDA1 family)
MTDVAAVGRLIREWTMALRSRIPTKLVVCSAVAWILVGCAAQWPGPPAGQTAVTLTFDDGPLAADVLPADRSAAAEELLDPLFQILDVLERRGLEAVFYVVAPGDDRLTASWTEGLLAIHSAGGTLGYHAFDHDALFWFDPLLSRPAARARVLADYRQLRAFVDQALAPAGITQQELFSPVFRMPYGDGLNSWLDGPIIARQLGWTCHGYAIDSMDWTLNADVPAAIANRLLAAAGGDPVALVNERLGRGARAFASYEAVDVLMHVNSLTAAHLDEWIDTLTAALQSEGVESVDFSVSPEYLADSQPAADLSALLIFLFGDAG